MADDNQQMGVKVTGIDMPFDSMVVFILKWTFASIPSVIAVYLMYWMALQVCIEQGWI